MTTQTLDTGSGAYNEIASQVAAKLASGRNPDLAKAYVQFWGACHNVLKDATNPHFKNRYATLEAALNVAKPIMAANKLALLQMPGPLKGEAMTLTTMLVHESGQAWTFTTELPIGPKATAQAAGSCITYARRYALMALAGVAPTDEDGNEASGIGQAASTDASAEQVTRLSAAVAAIVASKATKMEAAKALEELKKPIQETGDKKLVAEFLAKRAEIKVV